MEQSYIDHHSFGGTSLVGPDSVKLYQAAVIRTALSLYAKTGIRLMRQGSPTVLLQQATAITGKQYKRGQYAQAAEDLGKWIVEMRAALPHLVDGKQA